MKIYIAAPYLIREEAISIMHWLESTGHLVTSRWLRLEEITETNDVYAGVDLEDVELADLLLAINFEGWENKGTGGRHVEFGYALALKKQVVILGTRSNIFHHLKSVRLITRIEDL